MSALAEARLLAMQATAQSEKSKNRGTQVTENDIVLRIARFYNSENEDHFNDKHLEEMWSSKTSSQSGRVRKIRDVITVLENAANTPLPKGAIGVGSDSHNGIYLTNYEKLEQAELKLLEEQESENDENEVGVEVVAS